MLKSNHSSERVRALRLRNALAPISSLPTVVITDIFSFLHSLAPPVLGVKPDWLALLHVTHVCHQWREIALNNPFLWRHINFTNITLAGVSMMLARAKEAPLYLEARFTGFRDDEFDVFNQGLQSRIARICHLTITADIFFIYRTLRRLASPAPILEYLSLSFEDRLRTLSLETIPDRLFDGTTPRLSCLKLHNCGISWKSPLLKGLRYLEIHAPSKHERPSLVDWLDTLEEMPQLKRLVLRSASPIAPPLPFDTVRTVTLPFLMHMDISASVGDCALALSHLVLPVLTRLDITAKSSFERGADALEFLPYVTRHSHGPQDTQPLQNVLIRNHCEHMEILAWPGVDVETYNFPNGTMTTAPRVALSVKYRGWLTETHIEVLNAAIAALPLDNLAKLTTRDNTLLDEQFWCHHAPRWPLLQHVQLFPRAARGLREMILQDNGVCESPSLPSLTKLDLLEGALRARTTHRLCDALMKRVEQGVPLVELNLRWCRATSYAIQLLSGIVGYVWGPDTRYLVTSGAFIPDDNYDSEADYYSTSDESSTSEDGDEGEIDDDEEDEDDEDEDEEDEGEDEGEEDYL